MHRTGKIKGINGYQLHIESWEVENAKGMMIIQHGLKDHIARYTTFAERLVRDMRFNVYGMDLQGHGQSEGPHQFIERFENYVSDLDAFVRLVRKENVPLFLFGHSMGGQIVLRLALKKPFPISGLLFSAAALSLSNSRVEQWGATAISYLLPKAGVLKLNLEDFNSSPEALAEAKKDPFIYPEAVSSSIAGALVEIIPDSEKRFGEISVPIFVMHGTADKVTPQEGSEKLAHAATSSVKILKFYDGCYHDLVHEPVFYSKILPDMEAFLKSLE